jgi:hypothetical protein
MPEEHVLYVRNLERALEQRIVIEINLPNGEIIRGPPVSIHFSQQVWRQCCFHDLFPPDSAPGVGVAANGFFQPRLPGEQLSLEYSLVLFTRMLRFAQRFGRRQDVVPFQPDSISSVAVRLTGAPRTNSTGESVDRRTKPGAMRQKWSCGNELHGEIQGQTGKQN